MLSIKKISKNKKDYTLEFSNGEELVVSERIVIEYLVSTNKEISMDEFYEIKERNHYYQVLDSLINTLVHKRMLTSEIKALLKKEDELLVHEVIKDLVKLNLVDDTTYILDFINDKANFNHYGKNKIYQLLLAKDCDKDLLNKIFLDYDEDLDRCSLEKIIKVELKAKKKDNLNHYLMKLKTSLVNKGFDSSLVLDVLNEYKDELKNNLLEEDSLDKAILKYKDKYDKYKLKQKLYSLGFSMDLINEKLDLLD